MGQRDGTRVGDVGCDGPIGYCGLRWLSGVGTAAVENTRKHEVTDMDMFGQKAGGVSVWCF